MIDWLAGRDGDALANAIQITGGVAAVIIWLRIHVHLKRKDKWAKDRP